MPIDTYELTMSGPGRNALGSALMERMLAELRAASGQAVLVTGAGAAFSAGLDLKEVATLDRPGMARFLGLLEELIDTLFNHPGPTVACVNGHAIAGGCIVALCCDLRVASDDPAVRIGLNEVPLGLEFPPRLWALVRARVPVRFLERVVLDGALHSPQRARELGLVDEVSEDAPGVARAALARLAAHPRDAYLATKRALRARVLDLSDEQRRYFHERIVPSWCAAEVKERVLAALGGRR